MMNEPKHKSLRRNKRNTPVDSNSCNRQETNANVSVPEEGYENAQKSYVRPAGVDEPDGIEREHQQTEHKVRDAQAVTLMQINVINMDIKRSHIMGNLRDNAPKH